MSTFSWPGTAAAAISLTFDDGAPTHLSEALPRLEAAGLRGTFYLNPGRRPDWGTQVERWKQAALEGHELGNHTSRHPFSCNFHFDDGFCLERLTLQDMAQTIDEAEVGLDEISPQHKGHRTFCYPCYQSDVGRGLTRQSYIPLVAERFRAARGWGERPNDPTVADLWYLGSWAVEGNSGQELIDYAESAIEQGRWAVFCFHGVGGDHIAIDAQAFQMLLDHLSASSDRLWTAPLVDVADHVMANRTD